MPHLLRNLVSRLSRRIPIVAASGGRNTNRTSATLAIAGFSAGAVALAFNGFPNLKCETQPARDSDGYDVKLTTYNILAPKLCSKKQFPYCPNNCTLPEDRWPKVLEVIRTEVSVGSVVALQEVDLQWAGRLHAWFAEHDYVAVFGQYGKSFNGYMGVMVAWPRSKYEALDVDISRISDTAPNGTWPKRVGAGTMNAFGMLTRDGMKDVIGCFPPDLSKSEENFEWNLARSRFNEAVCVRLRPRSDPSAASFCVGTYHMPCLFGSPENVRVVNIHSYLLVRHLREFARESPTVLMGDFNFKPHESPYALVSSGGSFIDAAAVNPEEVQGLPERLQGTKPWPDGLQSAYKDFHKQEPRFTNFAQLANNPPFVETLDYIWYTANSMRVVDVPRLSQNVEEVKGPFPNQKEPSDHVPVRATIRILKNPNSKL